VVGFTDDLEKAIVGEVQEREADQLEQRLRNHRQL
jgi:hypothetical protein